MIEDRSPALAFVTNKIRGKKYLSYCVNIMVLLPTYSTYLYYCRANPNRREPRVAEEIMAATATSKSTSLCPFTLKFIAEIKQEDLAVIYKTNPLLTNDPSPVETDGSAEEARAAFDCGHACTLANLVSYLHDGGGNAKMCPACQLSPASVVCDSPSSDYLTRPSSSSAQNDTNGSNGDGGGGRIISFRYGTVFYFLWVQSPPPSLSSSSYEKIFRIRNGNALHRIGSVLGMDVESGLKVRDGETLTRS